MTTIIRETERDRNHEQRTACLKHAGYVRFAYHWGLARAQEISRATGKRPTAIDLHRELNALKKTAFPWMDEVSQCALQEALRDLEQAFSHFFRRLELQQPGKWHGPLGFPTFKKKSRGPGSFRLTGYIPVFADAIQLLCLVRLRLKDRNAAINLVQEALRTTGRSSGSHACGQNSSGRLQGDGVTALAEAGTNHCSGLF